MLSRHPHCSLEQGDLAAQERFERGFIRPHDKALHSFERFMEGV